MFCGAHRKQKGANMIKVMKGLFPASLMGRSLLILILPVVLIQLVTSYVFFDRHWTRIVETQSETLSGELAMLADEVDSPQDTALRTATLHRSSRYLQLRPIFEEDAQLDPSAYELHKFGWERVVADIFEPALLQALKRPFGLRLDFSEKTAEVHIQLSQGVLHVYFPKRRIFSSSGYIYLLWVFGSALLLLLTAIMFMRNQIRPIRRLAVAAENLGRGQSVETFQVEGAHEVRQASGAFVEMAGRIQKHLDQRAIMLAGVSHDLRTPLTRLRLELSFLGDKAEASTVEAMRTDLSEMERMIDGYLAFVRGQADEEPELTDVMALTARIVAAYNKGSNRVVLEEGAAVMGMLRPLVMSRCIDNIIGNGLKYANQVWVNVVYVAHEKRVIVQIEDDGEGLPEDQYAQVFKPFYRVDTSRAQGQGSVGLGMSIALDAVRTHGGDIRLGRSSSHGGLLVEITLPC